MQTKEKLPPFKIATYAIGQLGWATLINLIGMTLVYYYHPPVEAKIPYLITQNKFFYLFNAIMLIAAGGRFFEAFVDPMVASMSDRSRNPRGRRLPLMKWAALPAALFAALLFIPPGNEPSTLNVVWIMIVQFLFFTSFAFYVMPHNALLIELGHNEGERLNISTWISVTFALGIIVCSQIPAIAEALQPAFGLSKLEAYQATIAGVCAFAFLCMLAPVLTIDERRYTEALPSEQQVWESLKSTMSNKLFRQFVFSDCAYWMGLTIIETGFLYYVTVLIGEKESFLSEVMPAMLIASFLMYPAVNAMAKRFGKKTMIQAAFLIFGLVFALIFFLGKIPINRAVQIYTAAILAGIPAAFLGILPNTVLADISELETLRTGINQEGMFFAARTTFMKMGQTMGILIFAGLLTFGKDTTNDFGVRLSGVAGLALCLIAFGIFQTYREKETLAEIKRLQAEKRQTV